MHLKYFAHSSRFAMPCSILVFVGFDIFMILEHDATRSGFKDDAFKFGLRLGSTAVETAVKFKSDSIILTSNSLATRLHGTLLLAKITFWQVCYSVCLSVCLFVCLFVVLTHHISRTNYQIITKLDTDMSNCCGKMPFVFLGQRLNN